MSICQYHPKKNEFSKDAYIQDEETLLTELLQRRTCNQQPMEDNAKQPTIQNKNILKEGPSPLNEHKSEQQQKILWMTNTEGRKGDRGDSLRGSQTDEHIII